MVVVEEEVNVVGVLGTLDTTDLDRLHFPLKWRGSSTRTGSSLHYINGKKCAMS